LGLSISIGYLAELLEYDPEGADWLEESFGIVNQVLRAAGLPAHTEPRTLPPLNSRSSLCSFPYSFIHYLRRAYARRLSDPNWLATPLAAGEIPIADPVFQSVSDRLESHLICHSDAEGFYVPIDFRKVLFAESDEFELPGGMLGSSYRLLEELVLVAPALGITLQNGELADQEAARINSILESDEGLSREYAAWLALYEAARLSIEHKSAIVFA
jgi:hypothetical protein